MHFIEIYDLFLSTFFTIEFNWCTIFLFWLTTARRKIFTFSPINVISRSDQLESNYKTYLTLTYQSIGWQKRDSSLHRKRATPRALSCTKAFAAIKQEGFERRPWWTIIITSKKSQRQSKTLFIVTKFRATTACNISRLALMH